MNSSAKAGLITSKPMEITVQSIQSSIYTIRNQQVMLDADLAAIYGYEVRALNQQVKRNISRFPEDFMFQLTKEEVKVVKSQIVISSDTSFFAGQSGGRRKPPYAFTEQGIYMLVREGRFFPVHFSHFESLGDSCVLTHLSFLSLPCFSGEWRTPPPNPLCYHHCF